MSDSLLSQSDPVEGESTSQTTQITDSSSPATPVATLTTDESQPSPTFQGLLGEDGTFRPDADWKPLATHLGIEKYSDTLKKYKSPEEMVRGLGNLQGLVGARPGVEIPTADSPEHVVQAYREATGVPEAVTGYEIPMPEGLPEGFSVNEGTMAKVKDVAHRWNTPVGALQEIAAAYFEGTVADANSMTEQSSSNAVAQRDANLAELQNEWKGDFDKNLTLARRVAISRNVQDGDPILATPSGIKLLVELGGLVREDSLPINRADHTQSTVSDFQDMVKNPSHPNHHRYHNEPGFARAIHDRMNRQSS
jgi:hypothetical protein